MLLNTVLFLVCIAVAFAVLLIQNRARVRARTSELSAACRSDMNTYGLITAGMFLLWLASGYIIEVLPIFGVIVFVVFLLISVGIARHALSTGRAYQRVRDAFKEEFETLISPDALIIVEHGTKIVRRDGEVVQADYFTKKETEHFVDFIEANADIIQFASYAPSNPLERMQLWVKDPKELAELTEKRNHSDVFHCSYKELKKRIAQDSISHFIARLQDYIVVENLKLRFTRSDMDLILMDGYMQFIGNLSDKAKAIGYLEKHHQVLVADMLIAGNGINDVDMLNLEAGKRILVGDAPTTPMVLAQLVKQEEVIRVVSPEALGEYLQKLL